MTTVTFFKNASASSKSEEELSLEELKTLIQSTQAKKKEALPWLKLATFGTKKTDKGSLRHDANVTSVTGVEFDYDGGEIPIAQAVERLREAKVQALVYASPSYTDEKPRWRILCGLEKPLIGKPAELKTRRSDLLRALEGVVGVKASTESNTLSQSYFFGGVGKKVKAGISDGEPLDEFVGAQKFADLPPSNPPKPTIAEQLTKVQAGDELHPSVASVVMTLANRYHMPSDVIRAVVEPAIRLAERDEGRIRHMLSGGELDRIIASAIAKSGGTGSPVLFRHISDVLANPTETEWLIPDILERGVLALLSGPMASFKSFTGLHWILTAIVFHGASGFLLTAEGADLDRRVAAWLKRYAPDRDPATLPFYAYEKSLSLNVDEVLDRVIEAIESTGVVPNIIGIDTLSKYTPGLEENSSKEMSLFLSALARRLKEKFGSTVLLVGHTGHSDQTRARGSYALRANTDAEYNVSAKDRVAVITRRRFKSSPALPDLAYYLEEVDLGREDKRGQPIKSLVPVNSEFVPTIRTEPPESSMAGFMLAKIRDRQMVDDSLMTYGELATFAKQKKNDVAKQTVSNAIKRLTELGWLAYEEDSEKYQFTGSDE